MKILVTGANGYVGRRLIPVLVDSGYEVVCCVRDKNRLKMEESLQEQVEVREVDFLQSDTLKNLPLNVDIAFYLIHSMSSSIKDFVSLEEIAAENFVNYINKTNAQQIIYLTGIINDSQKLSPHMQSRFNVEKILQKSVVPTTILRAGIIVGSGSASFEIIRDLVEKIPVMVTPKWVKSRIQPIAIRDVVKFLTGVINNPAVMNQTFDIGGPEILSYREMLLEYARARNIKRFLFTLPFMTPRLSSYWLYFVTSTSYKLAINLVDSMKMDVVCSDNRLKDILQIETISYRKAIELAFERIEQNMVMSSWKDAFISSMPAKKVSEFVRVPSYGCFKDVRIFDLAISEEKALERIWSVGGEKGWYYATFLWAIRGFIDRFAGGVGLRRGRTNPDNINPGDALDFWRVIVADKSSKRLLLYAEMKLPGEAWLEFNIDDNMLIQTATFRPRGVFGRIYWFSLLPFHKLIFKNMAKRIAKV